jgi:hypothetical protein
MIVMDGYLGGSGRGIYKTHTAGITKELARATRSRFESDTQENKLDIDTSLFQPTAWWLVSHKHNHPHARTHTNTHKPMDR